MSVSVQPARAVVNDCWHHACPCCGSSSLLRVGAISYGSPTPFSTEQITTARVPELWECRRCHSKFTQNSLTEHDAEELYRMGSSGERWKAVPFRDQQRDEVIRVVEAELRPGALVIDVGCNTGEFLDFARGHGCQTGGVEFSEASSAIAAAKGHAMYASLQALDDRSADVITAFDLVEHLYHPAAFIATCHGKLKPGGKLLIVTGNPQCLAARLYGARWWYVSFPEHIVFPSRSYFAEHTPFRLERVTATYANKASRMSAWQVLRSAIYGIWHRTGSALQLGPDHMLVVLCKTAVPVPRGHDVATGIGEVGK